MISRGQALKANSRIVDSSTLSDAIFYVFDMQLVRTALSLSERSRLTHFEVDRPSEGFRHRGVYYNRAPRRPPYVIECN